MDASLENDLSAVRQQFSKQLIKSFKKAYNGKMPSLSTISRDLALRSPYLPQVSNETVRKWLIGESIPNAITVLALSEWLGEDVLAPLKGKSRRSTDNHLSSTSQAGDTIETQERENLYKQAFQLSVKDRALVKSLIENLNSRD